MDHLVGLRLCDVSVRLDATPARYKHSGVLTVGHLNVDMIAVHVLMRQVSSAILVTRHYIFAYFLYLEYLFNLAPQPTEKQ